MALPCHRTRMDARPVQVKSNGSISREFKGSLTLLELQSRFGDKPLEIPSSLSPKRDCSPQRVKLAP